MSVAVVVCFGKNEYRILVDLKMPTLLQHPLLNEFKVEFEDFLGFFRIQSWIVKTHVNTGCKCFIEVAHTVCGQEQNTGVVFENSKEDYDEIKSQHSSHDLLLLWMTY